MIISIPVNDHLRSKTFPHTVYVLYGAHNSRSPQIIAILNFNEADWIVNNVCHEADIPEADYCNCNAKYGGIEAADIKKIKDLQDYNRRLMQMLTGVCRSDSGVTGVERRYRKSLKTATKGDLICYVTTQLMMKIRQVCRTLSLNRAVFHFLPNM